MDFRAMFAPEQETPPDFKALFAPAQSPTQADAAETPVDFMKGYTRSIIGQGAGMGFGEEVEAGIRTGLAKAQGDERELNEIYTEQIDTIRKEQKGFQKEHPVISTGAELAGAMIPMALSGGTTAPASLAQAMGRGALTGLGYGAGYGFGGGEGTDERFNQALTGGALGGAVGGVAAPVAKYAGKALNLATRPITSLVRGLANPEAQAGREVAGVIQQDQLAAARNPQAAQGLTQQQEAYATQVTGQPITNLDRGGASTRQLARSATSISPEANATLNNMIDDRFAGQGERINDRLRVITGFTGDASATREAATAAARAANRPNYVAAYKAGDWNVTSPELERLSQAPEVQAAFNQAVKQGKSVAIADKMPWQPPDRRRLQLWDYAQRNLRSEADKAARAGDKERARVFSSLRRQVNAELDKLVPEFNTARSGAAKFFGAEDAGEAGRNFINLNVDMGAARREIAKFSPAERQVFQEEYVSALMDKVSRVRDRANVVQQIWGNTKSRQQIEVALGPVRAKEVETFMGIETVMNQSRGSVQKYPGAGRQLAEMAIVGAGTGYASGDPITGIATALTWGAGRKIGQGITNKARQETARHVAEMLASNDPTKYRQAMQAISKSKQWMASLRSYITALASVEGAQQGSQLGAGAE